MSSLPLYPLQVLQVAEKWLVSYNRRKQRKREKELLAEAQRKLEEEYVLEEEEELQRQAQAHDGATMVGVNDGQDDKNKTQSKARAHAQVPQINVPEQEDDGDVDIGANFEGLGVEDMDHSAFTGLDDRSNHQATDVFVRYVPLFLSSSLPAVVMSPGFPD